MSYPRRLPPCPRRPNCVSSQADDAGHFVEPFRIRGDLKEAWAALRSLVAGMDRTTIVEEADGYLRAEARSRLFRFVDDLELLLETQERRIHVRSASRVGYGDLGVNRRRVEGIRRGLVAGGFLEGERPDR